MLIFFCAKATPPSPLKLASCKEKFKGLLCRESFFRDFSIYKLLP